MQKLLFVFDATPMGKRNFAEELALATAKIYSENPIAFNLNDDNYIKHIKIHNTHNQDMIEIINRCESINDPRNHLIMKQVTKRIICIGIVDHSIIKKLDHEIIRKQLDDIQKRK